MLVVLVFRQRRRETSRRPPIVESGPNSPSSGAHPDLPIATEQGALSSHFNAPSDVASQLATGQTPEPQQMSFSHKVVYDPNRWVPHLSSTSHAQSDTLSSSTSPQNPPAGTNSNGTPSGPDAQHLNEQSSFGRPWSAVQNATTPDPLPTSFYSSAELDGEPVEAGQMSTRSGLPLYSPGGIQRDEGAPPLPEK